MQVLIALEGAVEERETAQAHLARGKLSWAAEGLSANRHAVTKLAAQLQTCSQGWPRVCRASFQPFFGSVALSRTILTVSSSGMFGRLLQSVNL